MGKAAKAAKDVIDMNIYELYKDQTEADPLLRAIKSYQGVLFEEWNKETIWGAWGRNPTNTGLGAIGFYLYSRCMPPRVCELGVGGFCPSLKLVDTYPMAKSGRYPVTGYDNNGNPVIDEQSGYTNTGFTENFKQPGVSLHLDLKRIIAVSDVTPVFMLLYFQMVFIGSINIKA